MKLFIAILGSLLLAAWLIEAWLHKHDRERARRRRERESESLRHAARPWWKEPDDDLGDH